MRLQISLFKNFTESDKQNAGTDQVFRLNWAANGRQGIAGPSDYSLFVGDLTEEVTDYMLQEAFRRYYPSVRSAKVSAE